MKQHSLRLQHPYAMLTKLTVSAFLLLIPLLQQILYRPQGLFEYISTMSLSTIYAIAVVSGAVAMYRTQRYAHIKDTVYIERGLFVKRRYSIPFEKVQTITVERSVPAAVFGAAKISVDTPAGNSKRRDASIYLGRQKVKKTVERLFKGLKTSYTYTVSNVRMLLMSASWSNPGVGLLFLAPLVKHTGAILGEEFNNAVYESVDIRFQLVSFGITPAAATIANLLVLGWAVAMTLQFFRYARFSSKRLGNYIVITRGIGKKNERYTKCDRISALTINQTLTMALFKLKNAGIFSIGSGKDKGDKSLIAVAAKENEIRFAVKNLVGMSIDCDRHIKPQKKKLFSYICIPLYISIAVAGLISILIFLPIVNELFFTALIISQIPLLWWIGFRIFSFFHSELGYSDSCVIAGCYNRLTHQRFVIPYDKIQYVCIKQNPFQKHSGACDVRIYLYFEKRACRTVKHLRLCEAEEMIKTVNERIK